MRLQVNGLLRVTANGISTPDFEAVINGSSTVTISGSSDSQRVTMFGSSRYEAGSLASRDVEVNVAGSSFALINARNSLSGQVTGTGVVRYIGNPNVSVDVSGGGSVGPE